MSIKYLEEMKERWRHAYKYLDPLAAFHVWEEWHRHQFMDRRNLSAMIADYHRDPTIAALLQEVEA